ncbi:YopX family protein [Cytobacillus praedii]|uniref:YopX family protein n=1 Tax=Cytobacillus praedii TaxID=1742358 RepID=UPI002E2378A0|nr:YopX family protein [Cytobacillus praedii]
MREKKFRGLEILTGDWVQGSHLKTVTGSEYIVPQNLIGNHLPQYAVDKDTVGEYTGLEDKNGKQIFEGDIIFIYDDEETESGWWENVIYHQGAFMAGDDNLLSNVHFRSKVIGNKYEGAEE